MSDNIESETIVDQLERLILKDNAKAMKLLSIGKSKESLKILQKALDSLLLSNELSQDHQIGENVQKLQLQLLAVTHNNLGCVFKK